MKRLLFLLTILSVGIVSVYAQNEADTKEKSIKESLYQEAVEALEQQRFVVTFHTEDWGSSLRLALDGRRNFMIIDGQKGFFQTNVDPDFSYKNVDRGVGLTPLKMLESDVVKTEKKCDKKGDILYTVVLKGGNLVGAKNAKEAKITLKKGSNDVVVMVKYRGGNTSYKKGSLYPIDAANIERGTLYR